MLGRFVSSDHYAELLARGRQAGPRMLELDPAQLARHYNRQPFAFAHALAGNEYFALPRLFDLCRRMDPRKRSEEHTSELQSLMRISYAVFCLKKTKKQY